MDQPTLATNSAWRMWWKEVFSALAIVVAVALD
jgi:hypothetical protein